MKILMLTQIYPEPDDLEGYVPTKTVAYFARDWEKMGHEVMVIHCQSRFPLPYYMIPGKLQKYLLRNSYALIPAKSTRKRLERIENGVKVVRLPMSKAIPSQAYSEKEMDRQVDRIQKACKKNRFVPELVAGHFANPCMELTARLGKLYHARTSFVFHNDCKAETLVKYRIDRYKDGIDIFGGRSERDAQNIKEILMLKQKPFVCYSGVPDDMVKKAAKECKKNERKKTVFLYAGGLVKKKHVDAVIGAYAGIKSFLAGDSSLEIIGAGSEEQRLKDYAKQLNVSDTVTFLGRISREDVASHMKDANIFTMISENEVFGMVYLEAMLQGCIVIASKGGGFDGIIVDGKNGFLCDAGDEDMLAKIYRRIIDMNVDERNRIGNAAIETAVQFSETRVAKKYLECATGDRI